jgi:hypothetical protein
VGEAQAAEALVPLLVHDPNRRAFDGCEHLILHAGGVEHDGLGVVFPGERPARGGGTAGGLLPTHQRRSRCRGETVADLLAVSIP